MIANLIFSVLISGAISQLWQNPEYLPVSNKPLCIEATIHVSKALIDIKGLDDFSKYYEDILKEVSRIFAWHNIKFNVVGWNFWLSQEEITIGSTIEETMPFYRQYVNQLEHPTDVHMLFVNINNSVSNLGKSFINGACTIDSYGIAQVGDRAHWDPIYAAIIVAHEIGHLLGFEHVDASNSTCKCPWPNFMCVMQPRSYFWRESVPTSFDSCNMKLLIDNPKSCLLDCDKPFFNSNPPVCGNNLHEEGEDCDCGFEESCILMGRRTCCNPSTCTFADPTHQCDEGACCDKCKFKRGNVCNEPTDECDLPDFCGGNHPHCADNYKFNGVKCASDTAYCSDGLCMTKNKYCNLLFPNSNTSYSDSCYGFASNYALRDCMGLTSTNLINMFCGTGKGICGQVYCNIPIINDPYYVFRSGSLSCYTLLDNPNNIYKNKVPFGGVCGVNEVCSYGNCVSDDNIKWSCRNICKQFEECNGLAGNCVPNDSRWFQVHQGFPDQPE